MKTYALLLISLLFFSCGSDKVVLLPEISHSEITEILDVSPAYLFYDETKKDSVELNRKNLIVTTNWLVNVDKRLILAQVIPHIRFIQEKKRTSSHKNEDAKNYYTCHDTSRKNLGFIEFTDVFYYEQSLADYYIENPDLRAPKTSIEINFDLNENITITKENGSLIKTNKARFITDLKEASRYVETQYLSFNKALSFQEYIHYKHLLLSNDNQKLKLSGNEFVY